MNLDVGVLGYIGIVWPKEHSPEVWSVPPGTPCILSLMELLVNILVYFPLNSEIHNKLTINKKCLHVPQANLSLSQKCLLCQYKCFYLVTKLDKLLGTKETEIYRYTSMCINPHPTPFLYGNGMVLHFYQQQESSTTKTVHKVINKRLKTYV